MSLDRERRIRERAYAIWEHEGRPEGRSVAHWLQALREVEEEERRRRRRSRWRRPRPKPRFQGWNPAEIWRPAQSLRDWCVLDGPAPASRGVRA